jgi:hypothetical protein
LLLPEDGLLLRFGNGVTFSSGQSVTARAS